MNDELMQQVETDDEPVVRESSEVQLERWLRSCYELAGFTDEQAARLIEAGVDWHRAVDHVTRGCGHETALEIEL